jgi:hypothetical protein
MQLTALSSEYQGGNALQLLLYLRQLSLHSCKVRDVLYQGRLDKLYSSKGFHH